MKRSGLFLILYILITTVSCRQSVQKWPSTGKESDAIANVLDSLYLQDKLFEQPTRTFRLVDSLENISRSNHNNKLLRIKTLYWKSVLYQHDSPDSLRVWIAEARNLTDSATYPYVRARLDLIMTEYPDLSNFLSQYNRLNEICEYFNQTEDTIMQMRSYRALSAFYAQIGDMERLKECAVKVNEKCRMLGNKEFIASSELNLALSEIYTGDSIKARKMLYALLKSPYAKTDSQFRSKVYGNLAQLESSPEYLQKALDLDRKFQKNEHLTNIIRIGMMRFYEQRGEIAKADSLLQTLITYIRISGDADAKIQMHSMLRRIAEDHKDYKVALAHSDSITKLEQQSFSRLQYDQLTKSDYSREIQSQEREILFIKKVSRLRLWVVLLVTGIALLTVIFIYKSRSNKLKIRDMEKQLRIEKMERDLQKEKASFSAMALSISERDTLIEDIVQVAEEVSGGLDPQSIKDRILKKIKISKINIREWDDFQTLYSRIHPLFLKRLKELYPDITEGDSKFALYISAGLSTKQIAQLMNVQTNSIKKNRQRLRARMHLDPDDDLEAILRNIL